MAQKSGKAECSICGHQWMAEIEGKPEFDPSLECPKCGSEAGMFIPESTIEDDNSLRCWMCGRKIKREGVCPHCNKQQRFG